MKTELPITDKNFVEKLIPQKWPFVMVDEIAEFTASTLISGFTPNSENIFSENGNFLAPGLLEHQAQSVALHTGYQFFLKNENAPTGYIGAVKFFEVERLPKIGEKIRTKIEILSEMMGVTLVKISSEINGEPIAHSEMKTVLK